jgi:hypothetical protein
MKNNTRKIRKTHGQLAIDGFNRKTPTIVITPEGDTSYVTVTATQQKQTKNVLNRACPALTLLSHKQGFYFKVILKTKHIIFAD